MEEAGAEREIVLVLCHSVFHDAFRLRALTAKSVNAWKSSRFIANFIILRKAEQPDCIFAITSKEALAHFAIKFLGEKPSPKQKEVIVALGNALIIVDNASIHGLNEDDSILVLCDTWYSASNFSPILVSNIPKKVEMAKEFYHEKDIPYKILTTMESEKFLRKKYPELSKEVDERMAHH